MKKRNWTGKEKLMIVLEGLREDTTIAEVCIATRYRKTFIIGGGTGFFPRARNCLLKAAPTKTRSVLMQKTKGSKASSASLLSS